MVVRKVVTESAKAVNISVLAIAKGVRIPSSPLAFFPSNMLVFRLLKGFYFLRDNFVTIAYFSGLSEIIYNNVVMKSCHEIDQKKMNPSSL